MPARITNIDNRSVQISTDKFCVKYKDSVFDKLIAKATSKKEDKRIEFLKENIGNAMKKIRSVEVCGADWDSSLNDIIKEIIKEHIRVR